MPTSFEANENGVKVVTVVPDEVIDIHGDGFGQMLVGFPTSKISVFQQQIMPPGTDHIERKVVATVQVPTLNLIALGREIERILKNNRAQMDAAQRAMDALLGTNVEPPQSQPKKRVR